MQCTLKFRHLHRTQCTLHIERDLREKPKQVIKSKRRLPGGDLPQSALHL